MSPMLIPCPLSQVGLLSTLQAPVPPSTIPFADLYWNHRLLAPPQAGHMSEGRCPLCVCLLRASWTMFRRWLLNGTASLCWGKPLTSSESSLLSLIWLRLRPEWQSPWSDPVMAHEGQNYGVKGTILKLHGNCPAMHSKVLPLFSMKLTSPRVSLNKCVKEVVTFSLGGPPFSFKRQQKDQRSPLDLALLMRSHINQNTYNLLSLTIYRLKTVKYLQVMLFVFLRVYF